MACYHPLRAYRARSGRLPNGKWPIVFNQRDGFKDLELKIPCGQCIGCRLEISRQWSIRCMHEKIVNDDSIFATFTYNNEKLLEKCAIKDESDNVLGFSLNKREFVLFVKRLRKSYPLRRIRYFHCGEYGEKFNRPHHHAILFGIDFEDKVYFSERNGQRYYQSEKLDKIWRNGNVIIGNVTAQSCAYVARYITKKMKGKLAEEYYEGRQPEYVTMSRKPPIGNDVYQKNKERFFINDMVQLDGKKLKPPKAYERRFQDEIEKGTLDDEKFDSYFMERLKLRRKKNALKKEQMDDDRLADVERLKIKKSKLLVRTFDKGEENDF